MASGSSDAGNVSPSPASILLSVQAHVGFSRNPTTARAKAAVGDITAEATFWIASPPDVSFYTFFFDPIPDPHRRRFPRVRAPPRVVGAEGRFVLISVHFSHRCLYEYFMYRGDPESPSLESVPLPDYDDAYSLHTAEFAIVPCGDDDSHYLLIALSHDDEVEGSDYRLHIYSSEDRTWTAKQLLNPCPEKLIMPAKVFVLRDGLLLWVDFLEGILVCRHVHEKTPCAEYIPLPRPLSGNIEKINTFVFLPGDKHFRDLTCVNGLVKFVEMEHHETITEITEEDGPPEKPNDPRAEDEDVLYDSDLITQTKWKPKEKKARLEYSVDGWSAVTWTREIGSNRWVKGTMFNAEDILVDDSLFSAMLSLQIEPDKNRTLRNLYSAWPTLSTDGNDIVYLKSCSDFGAALLAVDLEKKKALKVDAPSSHPFGRYFYSSPWHILRPCALANHLKMTPGISASLGAEMCSSANEPNNTTIHVGETNSYESENKRPRLSAEKVNHARNGPQITEQNVLIGPS